MSANEQLVDSMRSALAHLDEPAYLETHPLAGRIGFIAQSPNLSRGQLLRRTLRLAIEALDPGLEFPANSPEARSYQVLSRHYVSKESIVAIATQLDTSERQAYRDLRTAVEALAQILSAMLVDGDSSIEPSDARDRNRAMQVREEVERLSSVTSQEVDIVELLATVVENARCLARDLGVGIQLVCTVPELHVAVNRVMLRQAFLNLLSHIVRIHRRDCLCVSIDRVGPNAAIEFRYSPEKSADLPLPGQPYAVAAQLLDSLGIRWQREDLADGSSRIRISMPVVQEHTVLIIDDNEGLISLFARYLRHQPYRVHGVADTAQVPEMLETLRPDAIILDVMMPGRDGWEILEMLRRREASRKAKVIVCSIIDDPKLAGALGADAFLHKPVDRGGLLRVLDQVLSSTT